MAAEVEVLASADDADLLDVQRLLAQLSRTADLDRGRFVAMLKHEAVEVFVIRLETRIVAMATLVSVPQPSGLRGHVEDVVVDSVVRGRGFAGQLLGRITQLATERGFRTVDLTSRPSRVSALRLYESAGFTPRDTIVLRYTPGSAQRT